MFGSRWGRGECGQSCVDLGDVSVIGLRWCGWRLLAKGLGKSICGDVS